MEKQCRKLIANPNPNDWTRKRSLQSNCLVRTGETRSPTRSVLENAKTWQSIHPDLSLP